MMKALCVMICAWIALTAALPAESAQRKKEPRAALDQVYMQLLNANTEASRGREVQSLRGILLSYDTMVKLKKENPGFEPKEVDDIIRVLEAQINVTRDKVQKDGKIEYRGKKLTFDEFKKYIHKELDRQKRWEDFQRFQEDQRRWREQQRIQEDIRRAAEMKRFQDDLRRMQEQRQWNEEMRRQAEERRQADERREAEERRRRYEEQMRRQKP